MGALAAMATLAVLPMAVLAAESCQLSEPAAALLAKVNTTEAELREADSLLWAGKSLSDDDIAALGDTLAAFGGAPALISLHLGGNQIGADGARVLAESFSSGLLPNLAALHLGGQFPGLGDEATVSLASSLGSLPRLTTLTLYSNRIGDEGTEALALAASMGALANIEILSLRKNLIGDAGVEALCGACEFMPHATSVNLRPNLIGEAGEAALAAASAKCESGRCGRGFCENEREKASSREASSSPRRTRGKGTVR